MATHISSHDELTQALSDPNKVVLIVMGKGAGMDKIVERADNAIFFPETQLALWVDDVTILTPAEGKDYQPGDPKYVACALSTPPRLVCARVSRQKALAAFFMQAIEAAEARTQPAEDLA